jgi:hypothetical protein
MDERVSRDDTPRLASPKVRRLSPASEMEAVRLLAALLAETARPQAVENVVPISLPARIPVAAPIGPRTKQRKGSRAENPSKSMRSAA